MNQLVNSADITGMKNIQTVLALYEEMINGRKPKEATNKYLLPDYIQHNPLIPTGAESLGIFFEAVIQNRKKISVTVHRVIAVGDFVWAHVHFKNLYNDDVNDLGIAGVDIYRFEGDRIAEHWDTLQVISDTSANENGMF